MKEANAFLIKNNPSILVVGADHANTGLTRGLIDLITSALNQFNLNCLFLELPSDIQNPLDQAIENNSLKIFSQAFLESKINSTAAAYIRLGAPANIRQNIREAFAAHYNDPLLNNSVSAELITFLKMHHFQALAFDTPSDSKEFQEATYYSVQDQKYGRTLERDILSMKISNQRSQIMSQKIQEKFKSSSCDRALVVVGYAHLFSDTYFKKMYSAEIGLRPLQILLNDAGLKSVVLLSEKAEGLTETSLDTTADPENRFPLYLGKLLNP